MTNIDNATTHPVLKTRMKNDYVKLKEGAYPHRFEEQVEKAITAVATDNLRATKMVRRDKRSRAYLLTMGFDKRNWWFENNYIPRGEVAEFDNPEDVISVLRTILKAARDGEFNGALEALRIQRQAHADTMLDAKKRCGFHRLPKPKVQALLPAPAHQADSPDMSHQHQ